MRKPLYVSMVSSLILALAGCTVGPHYKRPATNAPSIYRGPDNNDARLFNASTSSLGDEKWWTVFHDPALQQLIRTALVNNYDVRIAATRILQERAQLVITRSNEFPTLSAGGELLSSSSPSLGAFPAYSYNVGEVSASASWDLDFWGRYRKATEAARANLASSEWGKRATISTLVSDTASDYFQLQALDLELGIARRTLASRQESLQLTTTLANGGSESLVDVRQAEQLVDTAAAEIPDLERQIQQEENAIQILTGQNPGPVARSSKLTDEPVPANVPAGLTSTLLERRPDIREAEENLVAANAQVGVARAQLFPDVSLTGMAGFESDALTRLFSGPASTWNYSGSLTQPLFEAGRLRANVRLSQAEKQQMVLTYQQTIQRAFSDVSNALIAYQKYREYQVQQAKLAEAAEDSVRLANMRYKGGVTSYLEVLTNDTNAFSAELSLAQAELNERLALVQLYNSLGGGWQQ